MLKAHHISPKVIAWIGAGVIVVIALSAAFYLKAVPFAIPAEIPVANPAVENPVQAPVDTNPAIVAPPAVARSNYVSEATLRRWLEEAYDNQQFARAQEIQRILNGRYEHRCCGLPR